MKLVGLALALAASAPGAAQTAPATVADNAATAAAQPVIDKLWPLGTYRRLMDGTMSKMIDGMMDQMFQMRAADIVPPGTKGTEAVGNRSLGSLASETDPYFKERMRITTDVMFKEMIPLFDRIEPAVRASMVRIYARKFTPAQLADLDRFLSTPTGQVYAREWMTSFMDPEIMGAMQSFAPELMKAMPAIMAKAQEATKHLPPPPKKQGQ